METIKTAVVVTCLLGVLYGVYTILNKPEQTPPPEVAAAWDAGEFGGELEIEIDPPDYGEDPSFGMGSMDETGADTQGAAGMPGPSFGVDTFGGASPGLGSDPGVDSVPGPPAIEPAPPIEPYGTNPSADSPGATSAAPDNTLSGAEPLSTPPDLGDSSPPNFGNPPDLSQPGVPPLAPDPELGAAPMLPSDPELPSTTPPADTLGQSTPPVPPVPPLNPAPGINTPPGDPITNGTVAGQDPTTAGAPTEDAIRPFERARRSALAQIDEGQLREALFTLSLFYDDPQLNDTEHRQLLELLDPLAGRVIYSREHLLTSAHVTQQGETLKSIAAKYQVPEKLLVNINGLQRPELLTSGTELKVVPGPFRATVDLQRGEMTLFLRRLYAGRFPISVGNDPTPKIGEFQVKEKKEGQTYYSPAGAVAANDPRNPYGGHWIDLGNMSVHGSPQATTAASNGCISLAPGDASDIYHILSVGSKISVIR